MQRLLPFVLSGRFQHTAARRRLEKPCARSPMAMPVSTHSRPKAADAADGDQVVVVVVSTHSRPKAADRAAILKSK